MKSGPVFHWRGSVALLCEACQRLMIRWNIQTPATRRQAHWYVVIPNRGLSDTAPQTFMHVHVLTSQTHTLHTHTHVCMHTYTHTLLLLPLCKGVDLWLKHGINIGKWLEEKQMTERFRDGNLAIDSRYVLESGEKSKLHERDLPLALMSRL